MSYGSLDCIGSSASPGAQKLGADHLDIPVDAYDALSVVANTTCAVGLGG